MDRRDFIKKLLWGCGGLAGIAGFMKTNGTLWRFGFDDQPPRSIQEAPYYRIVLLGDPHLPVREREVKDPAKRQTILTAKKRVVSDINSWTDVNQVQVLGDIVAQFGNEAEYLYAKQYFSVLKAPVSFIMGNHDYIYQDQFAANGKFVMADAAGRQMKLNRFKETLGLASLYYSQKVGRYLLIFLSPDSLDSAHLTEVSPQQLQWFEKELKQNASAPTIVFFHSPLAGTLLSYNKFVNTPNFITQPRQAIEQLVQANRQIILWVSGHTHTPATNESYDAAVNTFAGRVIDVHNSDMDREIIWTNSLYLYSDKIVIKTFNHHTGAWEDQFERTITVSDF